MEDFQRSPRQSKRSRKSSAKNEKPAKRMKTEPGKHQSAPKPTATNEEGTSGPGPSATALLATANNKDSQTNPVEQAENSLPPGKTAPESESSQSSTFKSPSKVPAQPPKTLLSKKERKSIPEVSDSNVVLATVPELQDGENLSFRRKL